MRQPSIVDHTLCFRTDAHAAAVAAQISCLRVAEGVAVHFDEERGGNFSQEPETRPDGLARELFKSRSR